MKHAETESDPWAVGWVIRSVIVVAFFAAFAVPMGFIPIMAVTQRGEEVATESKGAIVIPLNPPPVENTPTPEIVASPTPHITHIGIIAGHTGSDSGAVCPDGLQEVEINTEIARRVVALLAQRDWEVDLLEEFDVRLNGYLADALVSIHADSCNVPGKTGFKIARVESSYSMGNEDRLVSCMSYHYEKRTGLPFDPHTITYDMTRYHAFYEIDASTPAAVIEVGFMLDDRELLTQHQDVIAQGIVDGLVCFVQGSTP
ncbi:MAG: N-acetylmuramoyl-L-alanine amidase [Anaerolineae bacterium]|nr:N-acetylmuramoyl-L-alanine amidase [Anaerolineae bacterium]